MVRMRRLVLQVKIQLDRDQQMYKRNFYPRIRPMRPARVGQTVYFEQQESKDTDTPGVGRRDKLQAKFDGPYKIVHVTLNTVTILQDGLEEVMSRGRIAVAPPPPTTENNPYNPTVDDYQSPIGARSLPSNAETHTQEYPSLRRALRSRSAPDPADEQIFSHIVEYNIRDDLLRVRWFGYSPKANTWEPPGHLPYNAIAQFFLPPAPQSTPPFLPIPKYLTGIPVNEFLERDGDSVANGAILDRA